MEKIKKELHLLQILETAMLIGMLYTVSFIVITTFIR